MVFFSVTGAVLQPSDQRLKTDIVPLNPEQQLANVRSMKLYRYRLSDSWAETCGRTGDDANECGILAQEVAKVLPDAVRQSNSVTMNDGTSVTDLLVVNKERIFMENVGAVQQLGTIAVCTYCICVQYLMYCVSSSRTDTLIFRTNCKLVCDDSRLAASPYARLFDGHRRCKSCRALWSALI